MRFIKNISFWLLLATVSVSVPSFAQPGAETFHSILSQPAVSAYDADYQAVLDQATTLGYTLPDASERAIHNAHVIALKALGVWTLLDVYYPMKTNINFATLNWIAPTLFQLTLINSPTYSTATGFQGNGTTSYLTTGWSPRTHGVNCTVNECGAGVLTANEINNSSVSHGAYDGTNVNSIYIIPRITGVLHNRINQDGTNTVTNATSAGRYHQLRTGATALHVWKNGASIVTGTNGAALLSLSNMYICAMNANGTPANLGTRQIRYFWAGASLNTLEASFDAEMASFFP